MFHIREETAFFWDMREALPLRTFMMETSQPRFMTLRDTKGKSWKFFYQNPMILLMKPYTRPGKHTKNYGKIHHAMKMGKSTISTGPCSIAM
jgi:hypothetical protein